MMVKLKDLRVRVTYEVHLIDLYVPENIHERMKEIAKCDEEVELHSSRHPEVEEWLAAKIRERDCCYLKYEIIE